MTDEDAEIDPESLRKLRSLIANGMADAAKRHAEDAAAAWGETDPVALLYAIEAERGARLVLDRQVEALTANVTALTANMQMLVDLIRSARAENPDPYGLGFPKFDIPGDDDDDRE